MRLKSIFSRITSDIILKNSVKCNVEIFLQNAHLDFRNVFENTEKNLESLKSSLELYEIFQTDLHLVINMSVNHQIQFD